MMKRDNLKETTDQSLLLKNESTLKNSELFMNNGKNSDFNISMKILDDEKLNSSRIENH